MKKLNIAVIGTGSWGKNHARVFSELPNTNLMGIYDTSESRAKEISKMYNAKPFNSLEKLLSEEELDAVTIATPTTFHAEITLKAMEQGKHVLIEKPMTSTLEEAEKVIDLEKSTNLLISIGFIERFNPISQRSQQLVENNELGNVVLINARRLGPFWPSRLEDVDVIRDVSIHDIDGFRFITEQDPISVYARGGKLRHTYYDYSEILLDFGDGVTGFIESNYLTPHKFRKLGITCEHGIVDADFMSQEYIIEDQEFVKKRKLEWKEPLLAELKAFVNGCLDGKQRLASTEDGYKALKIAFGAMESIKNNKVIEFDF